MAIGSIGSSSSYSIYSQKRGGSGKPFKSLGYSDQLDRQRTRRSTLQKQQRLQAEKKATLKKQQRQKSLRSQQSEIFSVLSDQLFSTSAISSHHKVNHYIQIAQQREVQKAVAELRKVDLSI